MIHGLSGTIRRSVYLKMLLNSVEENIMLETLFWIIVGAFIGWNFPQPQYAKDIQSKYLQKYVDRLKAIFFFWK